MLWPILSASILDIAVGHWSRLDRVRFPLAFPTVRVLVAVVSPLFIRPHLRRALSSSFTWEPVSPRDSGDWLLAKFDAYALWSLVILLTVATFWSIVLAYCMNQSGIAGAKGIRSICRTCMVVALLSTYCYSLTALHKIFDLPSYLLLLAVCQNGYFYLPHIVRHTLAKARCSIRGSSSPV